ncbi:hypothetical protein ACLIA0_03195 [Bacillaceae bacterium W0354]
MTEENINFIYQALKELLDGQKRLEEKQTRFEEQLNRFEEQLNRFEEQLIQFGGKQNQFEGKQNQFEEKQNQFSNELLKLKENQKEIIRRIEKLDFSFEDKLEYLQQKMLDHDELIFRMKRRNTI